MNTSEVVVLTSIFWSEGGIDLSTVLVNLTDVDSSDDGCNGTPPSLRHRFRC